MSEYRGWSFEELRLGDYMIARGMTLRDRKGLKPKPKEESKPESKPKEDNDITSSKVEKGEIVKSTKETEEEGTKTTRMAEGRGPAEIKEWVIATNEANKALVKPMTKAGKPEDCKI